MTCFVCRLNIFNAIFRSGNLLILKYSPGIEQYRISYFQVPSILSWSFRIFPPGPSQRAQNTPWTPVALVRASGVCIAMTRSYFSQFVWNVIFPKFMGFALYIFGYLDNPLKHGEYTCFSRSWYVTQAFGGLTNERF